ncbi:umecyanin-like [Henckelia pumila]|uniref:umecyanin-like n=1 Tax=Henckelia pumila TaxID=405737 RepID=UPI003C6E62F1
METNHRILLTVLVVAAAAELVSHAAAATYTVGDSLGWRVPQGGPSTYENWASQYVFKVGDVLVFEFVTGAHDVAKVTQDSYGTCSATNPISVFTTGPANVVLNATGDHYFFCTFGRHCSLGQKLAVSVTGNSSTGQPPAPSRSPSAPTPSRSPSAPTPSRPPPSPNSGPTVTIGSCNMLIVIFVSILVGGILIV